MTDQPIYLETHDEVAVLVLNRPDKLNALNTDVWKGIKKFADEVAENPEIKVMILRGVTSAAFSAGADISEFPKIHATPETVKQSEEIGRAAFDARLSNLFRQTFF